MVSDAPAFTLAADAQRILNGLDSPETAPGRTPLLVLMVGLPGSGKSTLSRRLAAETGASVLESDAARERLFGVPTHSADEDRRLWPAIHEALRRLLDDRDSVILDATSLTEAHRQPLYDLAAATGAHLVIVEVTAAESVIARRLSEREKVERALPATTDWYDVYRRMQATSEPIVRPHLSVDTSDSLTMEEAFSRLVRACRQVREGSAALDRPGGID